MGSGFLRQTPGGLLTENATSGRLIEESDTLTVSFTGIDTSCWLSACLLSSFDPNDTFTLTKVGPCDWRLHLSYTCGGGFAVAVTIQLVMTAGTWTLLISASGTSGAIFISQIFFATAADTGCVPTEMTSIFHRSSAVGCCNEGSTFGCEGIGAISCP